MLTRKQKLLLFCLGRTTTPYEAAESWEGKKGTEINMGPWYACKSGLLKECLIIEKAQKGRKKLIQADPSTYLNRMDEAVRNALDIPLFLKYAPKIIDFMAKREEDIPDEGTFYYPVVFFLAVRLIIGRHLQHMLSTYSKPFETIWGVNPGVAQADIVFKGVKAFSRKLSKKERRELHLNKSNGRKIAEQFLALLHLAPAPLTKKMLVPMVKWSLEHSG